MKMKKIHLYTVVVFLLISLSTQAQREAFNWFYGSGQGITWNRTQTFEAYVMNAPHRKVQLTGIPTRYEPVSERPEMFPMSTREGCFTLSDPSGNLMFYSSGSTIYNRNHEVVPGATDLEGNYSAAQAGVVIPYPRHRSQYIVITIGTATDTTSGFAYSILDSEANGGAGGIVLPKNRQFTFPPGTVKENFSESLMATRHANGLDYWIVAVDRAGRLKPSNLVAWLVTEDGVSNTPVVSEIPNLKMSATERAYGYLKISPQGDHFALMLHEKDDFLWGEFDNETGVFSNMNHYRAFIPYPRPVFQTYGGEFSPDGKYLYISTAATGGTNIDSEIIAYVFEFEKLLQGDTRILKTYRTSTRIGWPGAMQLGPDMRMYMTMMRSSNINEPVTSLMYMFETPNEPLTTQIYALENLSPGTGNSGTPEQGGDGISGTRLGLPTFASSFFLGFDGPSTLCVGEEAVFVLNTNSSYIEVDFGEGRGAEIIPSARELRHYFKKPGNYLIRVRPLDTSGQPIPEEEKSVYTVVYSCYLPVNHNLKNVEY